MKIINSDCIEAMKAMPENSVDSIVTDPPYELGFMGKSWDSSGIAFNIDVWREALRVLKPGGHLIAFSGSRTYHRMAVAIEDAGFEIRDQIMWVYGSGFPKSMNISKAIDGQILTGKSNSGSIRFANENRPGEGRIGVALPVNGIVSDEMAQARVTNNNPATNQGQEWQGWGTALKPAHEPMVLARKPLIGTVANNVLTHGVGGLNIDGSRVAHLSEADRASATPQGKVTSNKMGGAAPDTENDGRVEVERPDTSLGRWPANFIHDGSDEVVALFPGNVKGQVGMKKDVGDFRFITGDTETVQKFNYGTTDSGSAARFFYCAKASKRDRNEGLDDSYAKQIDESRKVGSKGGNNPRNRGANERFNHHPTVKPTDLMRYLVRLVTPGGGVVLDPFMGSGSTGKACVYESFDFIGIDQSAEYVAIAQARIDFAQSDDE
jgi:site-specific DNA-methyltransferase (adenine-specific)